jgi:hypothetical protein
LLSITGYSEPDIKFNNLGALKDLKDVKDLKDIRDLEERGKAAREGMKNCSAAANVNRSAAGVSG